MHARNVAYDTNSRGQPTLRKTRSDVAAIPRGFTPRDITGLKWSELAASPRLSVQLTCMTQPTSSPYVTHPRQQLSRHHPSTSHPHQQTTPHHPLTTISLQTLPLGPQIKLPHHLHSFLDFLRFLQQWSTPRGQPYTSIYFYLRTKSSLLDNCT